MYAFMAVRSSKCTQDMFENQTVCVVTTEQQTFIYTCLGFQVLDDNVRYLVEHIVRSYTFSLNSRANEWQASGHRIEAWPLHACMRICMSL